eukprot:gene2028-3104_t
MAQQDHVVQLVMAQIANRTASASQQQQHCAPLAILGAEKPTSLVVYGSTGRKLNFSPEELQEPPEKFKGDAKLEKEWVKVIPVFTRKALTVTHFQKMSVEDLRLAMEKSVEKSFENEAKARKKKMQKRNQQKKRANASECILLRNMVGRGGLDDEFKDEIISEMVNYGAVVSATAHEVTDPNVKDEEAVRIFVRFETKDAAIEAQEACHLRVFDGRYVAACFFPLERFIARDLAPHESEPKLPVKCFTRFTVDDEPAAAEQAAAAAGGAGLLKPRKLPAATQALIDIIKLAAVGAGIPDQLIAVADPLTALRNKAQAAADEE